MTGGTITGANASGANVTATGTTGARTAADRAADLLNVKNGRGGQPGAKGDGQIATPVVTLSGTSLTVGSSLFAATDVGKVIVVQHAGVNPTIGFVQTAPVATPGSGYQTVPTCSVVDGSGSGSGATCHVLVALQSVTSAGAGGTCLNGAFEMVVGTDGLNAAAIAAGVPSGTPAKITGTIASNVVSGAVTVANGGLLSLLGNLTTAPAYGANCGTAPTFAMSYGVGAIVMDALGANYSIAQTTITLSGGSPSVAGTAGTPVIGSAIPALITTIASVQSSTQITLAATGATISGAATELLWATDDGGAFQRAINAGQGIWVPAGLYWVGTKLDPGAGPLTVRGEGMNNTILAFFNGTSVSQDSGNWAPLFMNVGGSANYAGVRGYLQFEDFQIRGTLDFGQISPQAGAPATELHNYTGVTFDRVKFFQIPVMAMQHEYVLQFLVANSIFDTVLRDQARCRACDAVRIAYSKFLHSDDDSIALHQPNYITGAGNIREDIIIEGNDFEDTTCIHILGPRNLVVRGNTLRRCKLWGINLAYDSLEGVNQIRTLIIADNAITDTITRQPMSIAGCAICLSVNGSNAPTGVTSALPGSNSYPSVFFQKPRDYDLNSVVPGAAFAPSARGVNIHDNIVMNTLPATPSYSAWGVGKMLSNLGFIDPPVPDTTLYPSSAITASINISGLIIHHNNLHNIRRGISLKDTPVAPSQIVAMITDNIIFDAWEYGIYDADAGNIGVLSIIGNVIDLDPYGVSPGRAGGNGGWSNAYAASKCVSIQYNVAAMEALNTCSNAYAPQPTTTTWLMSNNMQRGTPSSTLTNQINSYTAFNFGIGNYAANVPGQWFTNNVASSPSNNPPGSFGGPNCTHVTQSAAAPTTGCHYIGDIIVATRPDLCTCSGWQALTSNSSWVIGVDYVTQPLGFLVATVVPTTGNSITVGNGTGTYIVNPAGTLATLTITLPASGYSVGDTLTIPFNQAIGALTVSPNSGQTINGPAVSAAAITLGQSIVYRWVAALTWQRIQ